MSLNIQDNGPEPDEDKREQEKAEAEQKKIETDFERLKNEVDHNKLTEEQIQILKAYLLDIEVIGIYNDDNTPLDKFDSDCHNVEGGIIKQHHRLSEDEIIFMINVSEHVKRPIDMLMFLGEYFKEVIYQTDRIHTNITKNTANSNREQHIFYLYHDIMNSLGTACKQYIEAPRQQLRISIALSRNPSFENKTQADLLA